jgi:hypothetical protein
VTELEGLTVQSDGKIVVAGGSGFQDPSQASSVVGRLNADGSVDSTFGAGGLAFPSRGSAQFSFAIVPLIQVEQWHFRRGSVSDILR